MNTQERTLEVFARMARFVVRKQVKEGTASYDYVGHLINNMQMVNQTLTVAAITMLKKMKPSNEVDMDKLTLDMHNVINISVAEYAKTA